MSKIPGGPQPSPPSTKFAARLSFITIFQELRKTQNPHRQDPATSPTKRPVISKLSPRLRGAGHGNPSPSRFLGSASPKAPHIKDSR
ncbi:Protein of unknown function [Pyronema omphalodes CBS 100304]|uniref:Uncharacterized protein n=1 Tax=Pyronema omphalodes (strain CBS 100304) TaxID=1076935 RepID=U4LAU1_PYROM|nr:Protein of unknown function [Pyronema omphalodes CBS 100304]